MQLICAQLIDAERYVAEKHHLQIQAPSLCPHCRSERTLQALGYYVRNLTALASARVLRLWVRRFRCRCCTKTVSLLPSFAQPYRLIQNETIHRFVIGEIWQIDVVHWTALLVRYGRQFKRRIPEMRRVLSGAFQRAPPSARPDLWWRALIRLWGDIANTTAALVEKFQITLFGRYRCHRRNPASTSDP
jgi:hypothetical protein